MDDTLENIMQLAQEGMDAHAKDPHGTEWLRYATIWDEAKALYHSFEKEE